MNKAFAALDAGKQAALAEDLTGLATRLNRGDDSMVVPGDYLEIVVNVR
jgi:hypothetical protein